MRKFLRAKSLIIQGVYMASCVGVIVLCGIYHVCRDTVWGGLFIWLSLLLLYHFSVTLFAMPYVLVCNITSCLGEKKNGEGRVRRIVWALLAPVLSVLLFCALSIVFVGATGGV